MTQQAMKEHLITIPEFKAHLIRQGITATEWARIHGFSPLAVWRVLQGVNKGHHGKGHEILVAAGIKARPDSLAA